MKTSSSRLFGGVLLVAGTTIGAGMLAIPISTGMAGFLPTLALFILYWLLMSYTALCFLEVTLAMNERETNLISMAQRTLGKWGAAFTWVLYLFLLYALTTAYIAGSGPVINESLKALFNISLPEWGSAIPLLMIFGICVYQGTRSVDLVNRILMIGLTVAFFALIVFLAPHVDQALLSHSDWSYLPIGLSVVATSFGFHIIIPSLSVYMKRDAVALRKVILIGSFIPVVVYIIWEILALGIIPLEGTAGIRAGYCQGSNGAVLIAAAVESSSFFVLANLFSFFAIVTSFLGVSLSLSDFLADGLKIKKTRRGRLLLYTMTFIPPVLFTLLDPRAFLTALEFAGTYGVVVLLGFLPALMVWAARYWKGIQSDYQVAGGRVMLGLTMLATVAIVIVEMVNRLTGGCAL